MNVTNRALITGITGQDGSYLAEFLLDKGYQVIGMTRQSSTMNFERIRHIQDQLTLVSGDLLDQASLIDILNDHRPTEVYNLAAQSFVQTSWTQPVFTGEVTALGAARLLEAIRVVDPAIRFYQASTSEMFGKALESPQNEATPFHPRSPYGTAKLYGHWITVNYRESHGFFSVSGIAFNHESPRRGKEFVTRKIVHTGVRIKLGLEQELPLGNLDSKRDWGYTPDFVEAMWLMLQQENPEDYVLATGEAHSVEQFAKHVFEELDLDFHDYVTQDARFIRNADTDLLVGDPTKAKQKLGWIAKTSFEDLVKIMVSAELEHY